MRLSLFIMMILVTSLTCPHLFGQDLMLVANGSTDYKIMIAAKTGKIELKSANILQRYIRLISGAELKIVNKSGKLPEKFISLKTDTTLQQDAYRINTNKGNLEIAGGIGKGLLYGIYSFIEQYLHCKKLNNEPASVPCSKNISIPTDINDNYVPPFEYREVYYPACHDTEYTDWHKLQKFEDLWGLWGHSYNKLVPAKTYFKSHPEYYALVKGTRQATQLCLSNNDVYKLVVKELKSRIADNPDAIYWSVSPNDDIGNCECDKCKAIDDKEGGPQGSLIQFVNKVAAEFPDKKITTLAYGFTHRAPKTLKPATNVYIFLSNIDAYRDKPLQEEGTAAGFRNDLKAWSALTPNIFIWDYITQFTNYLAPFPNLGTLQPNMQFYKNNGVKGIFEQGSGDTYGELAELRSYITAQLLTDPSANSKEIINSFLKDYYGATAAKYMQAYIDQLQANMQTSKRKLDIYGNPVNEYNAYLSPDYIEQFDALFDKAEAAAESNPICLERINRSRLSLEYTVYQQARCYGIEKHGVFVKDDNGEWIVKPKLKEKIAKFSANCKKAGVTELSEGGLSPEQYLAEWDNIFKAGVTPTKALGANVTYTYPFVPEYPAKGNNTLTDGTNGYNDYSYNWLCFYGTPMVATIDLGKPQSFSRILIHFLDDPRHWIFLPENILIETSKDGKKFTKYATEQIPAEEEHYDIKIPQYTLSNPKITEPVRYIRVTALNLPQLPDWRTRPNKKPMLACDEIYVQ